MCVGDQSLPGGLTALIKQGERGRGRDKEGGEHGLKEDRSLQFDDHFLIFMPAWLISVALSRPSNAGVTVAACNGHQSLLFCQEEAENTDKRLCSTSLPATDELDIFPNCAFKVMSYLSALFHIYRSCQILTHQRVSFLIVKSSYTFSV